MTNVVMRVVRATKFAGVLALALAAAACANRPYDPQAGGSAPPGSQQDFVVNVGDRVFFESDSTELTPQSIATLEKQAQWLQMYNQYTFTVEGHADERGTREYNISARGSRAARTSRAGRGRAGRRARGGARARPRRPSQRRGGRGARGGSATTFRAG